MTPAREQPAVAERFAAQLLTGRKPNDPVEVAERLLAIQAQDFRGGLLAVRARSRAVTRADVERALSKERSLIISWLNRGTLHLIRSEDYWWLHTLTTPQLRTGNMRRLQQEGVSPAQAERGTRAIVREIERHGPRTRPQLRDALVRSRVPVAGQALVHVLAYATIRGHIVRGPVIGKQQGFVLVNDWLGPAPRRFDRDAASRELAVRYLAGHAPATDRDLAWWAGIPLRDARAALAAAGPPKPRRPSATMPQPTLLGPWEPLLVGWVDRSWILGANVKKVTIEGLFRSFALVRGKAVATWRWEEGGPAVEPFDRISRTDRAALDREAEAVVRFLET